MARAPLLAAALCWAVLVMSPARAEQSGDHPLLRREQRSLRNLSRADSSVARGAARLPNITCPTGSEACGLKCVNTQTDRNNCGRCGRTCESGSCKRGNCQCPRGRNRCVEPQTSPAPSAVVKCKNLRTDAQNCGKCGAKCQGVFALNGNVPQVCRRGQCRCPKKTKWCNDPFDGWTCQDTSSSTYNCGKCNQQCPEGAVCKKGRCTCPNNTKPEPCGFSNDRGGLICLNLKTDPNNCGSCGNECPGKCVNGTCACTLPGYTQCGAACSNLKTDPFHCGSCKNSCGQNNPGVQDWCCDGQCPNRNNCGGCGLKCAAHQECCLTECRNFACYQCVDLSSDDCNCGTCGNECSNVRGSCWICGNACSSSCKNGKCHKVA